MTENEEAAQAFVEQVTMPLLVDNDANAVARIQIWGALFAAIKGGHDPEVIADFRAAADALERGVLIVYESSLN